MYDYTRFYINGQWVRPAVENPLEAAKKAKKL